MLQYSKSGIPTQTMVSYILKHTFRRRFKRFLNTLRFNQYRAGFFHCMRIEDR